jgi:hypothetical protein
MLPIACSSFCLVVNHLATWLSAKRPNDSTGCFDFGVAFENLVNETPFQLVVWDQFS